MLDAAACNARRAERCGGPVATIAVGTNPVGVAVVEGTRTLYVANADSGTVSVIDAAGCNARATSGCAGPFATVAVDGLPLGLAVDEATQTVYVGNFDDFVTVIDAASCSGSSSAGCAQTAATIATGPVPAFPTFDATTRTLYVPDNGDGSGTTMSVIDTRAYNAANTSDCGHTPIMTTLGAAPTVALVDPETQTVYVPNQNDSTVAVLSGATCNAANVTGCGQTWPTVRVGVEPNASLALDHRSGTLFVVNSGSDTVSAVDAAHCNARDASGCGQVSRTLATGDAPSFIVLDPASDTLYVPNMVGGDVSVIDARGCNAQRTVACRREAPTIFTDGVLGLDIGGRDRPNGDGRQFISPTEQKDKIKEVQGV